MNATTPQASDLVGRTIQGRFVLKQLLGEGAMGAVFRGEGAEGEAVAVKVLWPHLACQSSMKTRFQREATAARRINHVNTVHVMDVGDEGDLSFIVMELIDGRSLLDGLLEVGKMAQTRAARILVQICGALGAAHQHGIVHRDLKPENVMLLGQPGDLLGERVKLLDFGVAKQLARSVDEDGPVTVFGALIGTAPYMAPEQWASSGGVDARADLYACGVLLYELVTGRQPFTGADAVEIGMKHLEEAPRPPSELAPGLDPMLEATILKALAKRPEDRHASALALRADLLRFLMPIPTRAEDRPAPAAAAPIDPLASTFAATEEPSAARAARAALATLSEEEIMPLINAPALDDKRPSVVPEPRDKARRRIAKLSAIVVYAAVGAGLGAIVISLSSLFHL